jgi:hypothetical protein
MLHIIPWFSGVGKPSGERMILDPGAAHEILNLPGEGAHGLPGRKFGSGQGRKGSGNTQKMAAVHQQLLKRLAANLQPVVRPRPLFWLVGRCGGCGLIENEA